jgi:hypothetical protein
MNELTNATGPQHESTYALLIRSEEKSRNAFEMAIYPLLILGPLIAIWQFAQQPINIPIAGWKAQVVLDASARNNVSRDEFPTQPGDRHSNIQG